MPLPDPIGRQREVLALPPVGHFAVLGTAGSGKTTLAIYRAAFLANRKARHGGRTLLLTFNRTLVAYLQYLADARLQNVTVENYHKFGRGYLNHRGKLPQNAICGDNDVRTALIAQAVATTKAKMPSDILKASTAFFSEEFRWMSHHGIKTSADYDQVERSGRTTARVPRGARPIVFAAFQAFHDLRTARGYLYDWDDLASAVLHEFQVDKTARQYRHIIIDEGQDFSPEMIRSLAAAIPENGSVTFFGDMAQQIYGRRMSWRSAGLTIDKVWQFVDNYRNSKQIASLGLAIASMPYFKGVADMVIPITPKADGPLPTIVTCNSLRTEAKLVAEQAANAAKTLSVAILLRDRASEDLLTNLLPRGATRLHRDLIQWVAGPGIYYGTYHAAKGLEFDMVILPFCDQDHLPAPDAIESFGDDAATQDGKLLYVGVTRAKSRLVITHSGTLTNLLPPTAALYHRVKS